MTTVAVEAALRRRMVQPVVHFPDKGLYLDFFLYETSKPASTLSSVLCTKKRNLTKFVHYFDCAEYIFGIHIVDDLL